MHGNDRCISNNNGNTNTNNKNKDDIELKKMSTSVPYSHCQNKEFPVFVIRDHDENPGFSEHFDELDIVTFIEAIARDGEKPKINASNIKAAHDDNNDDDDLILYARYHAIMRHAIKFYYRKYGSIRAIKDRINEKLETEIREGYLTSRGEWGSSNHEIIIRKRRPLTKIRAGFVGKVANSDNKWHARLVNNMYVDEEFDSREEAEEAIRARFVFKPDHNKLNDNDLLKEFYWSHQIFSSVFFFGSLGLFCYFVILLFVCFLFDCDF